MTAREIINKDLLAYAGNITEIPYYEYINDVGLKL